MIPAVRFGKVIFDPSIVQALSSRQAKELVDITQSKLFAPQIQVLENHGIHFSLNASTSPKGIIVSGFGGRSSEGKRYHFSVDHITKFFGRNDTPKAPYVLLKLVGDDGKPLPGESFSGLGAGANENKQTLFAIAIARGIELLVLKTSLSPENNVFFSPIEDFEHVAR